MFNNISKLGIYTIFFSRSNAPPNIVDKNEQVYRRYKILPTYTLVPTNDASIRHYNTWGYVQIFAHIVW